MRLELGSLVKSDFFISCFETESFYISLKGSSCGTFSPLSLLVDDLLGFDSPQTLLFSIY